MARPSEHQPPKRGKPPTPGERLTAFYRTGNEEGIASDGGRNFHGLVTPNEPGKDSELSPDLLRLIERTKFRELVISPESGEPDTSWPEPHG